MIKWIGIRKIGILYVRLDSKWTDEDFKIFVHFPLLKTMLINNSISSEELLISDAAIELVAHSCPSLHTIKIHKGRKLTDASMKALARGCPLLKLVNISNCLRIRSAGIKVLAQNYRNLTFLDISYTLVGDEGLVSLALCCPELVVLKATGCYNFSDTGLLAVASMSKLQYFDMPTLAEFSFDAKQQFANGCPKVIDLTGLGGKNITDEFVIAFARAHPNLRDLNLSRTRITDKSLIVVSNLCPNLLRLKVSGCIHVTDLSIISIARNCRRIEEIDISNMYDVPLITDVAIHTISDYCPALTRLSIKNSRNITESALVTLVEKCTTLLMLNMENFDLESFMECINHDDEGQWRHDGACVYFYGKSRSYTTALWTYDAVGVSIRDDLSLWV
jgi:hypothetical protein